MKNLEENINEEDKVILLVCLLVYSFEDVKTSLLAKEKYDSKFFSDEQAKVLMVRGKTPGKGQGSRPKFRSRSKDRNNKKLCRYCRKKGHEISKCFKLKNKE